MADARKPEPPHHAADPGRGMDYGGAETLYLENFELAVRFAELSDVNSGRIVRTIERLLVERSPSTRGEWTFGKS
jgi:hypothetical protein